MAPGTEAPGPLAGRLRRVGEMLIGLSGSPLPTHVFQTLAEQAETVIPHDYMAVCLEDAEQRGYLVHSLSGLEGEPVGVRVFSKEEGLPGRSMRTGRAYLVAEHDLKSPIMAIAMTAELLLRAAPPSDQTHRERCDRILRSSKQMTELVSDLLDLGKIEAGLESAGERVELRPLVEEAVAAQSVQAESKRIAIAVAVPPDVAVLGVRARLSQVLGNVVGNAVKYTRDGGRIGIAVERPEPGGPRRVQVSDTGIGIPARDLPHVFDKFYRVRNESTTGIAGTGLGLAITRSIVEAHAGRIVVESRDGVGSTFWVELLAAPGGAAGPSV